jgi:hypothetical protein
MYDNRMDVCPKCVLRNFFVVPTLSYLNCIASNDSTIHDEEKIWKEAVVA